MDECELEAVLQAYYQIMGWTPGGVPTQDKLLELGSDWVVTAEQNLNRRRQVSE